MSKHTPGPWTVNKPAHDNGRAEVYAGCMLVAQAYNWMLDAEGDEQCWADARLIAAAPDLLAALNAMLTHMGMDEDEWNKPTFDQARAAIKAVEGEKT